MDTHTASPVTLIFEGPADAWATVYTNPTQLCLGPADGESASARQVVRRLYARCAPNEPALASDYELWAVLCGLLPSLPGHPLYARVRILLRAVCGWEEPLCAANAAGAWQACVAVLNAGTYTVGDLAALWGARFSEAYRPAAEGIPPAGVTDTATLSSTLAARAASAPSFLWCLPDDYTFVRPNPYGAAQSLSATRAGTLTGEMRDHLLSQMLRITSDACRSASTRLEICGRAAALPPLTSYLAASVGLPDTRLWVRDPEDDASMSDLAERDVPVGLWLDGGTDDRTMRNRLTAYAAHFPLGAAPGVRMTVRSAADLAGVTVWSAVVQDQLSRWAATGQGTTDPEIQSTIMTRLGGGEKEIRS